MAFSDLHEIGEMFAVLPMPSWGQGYGDGYHVFLDPAEREAKRRERYWADPVYRARVRKRRAERKRLRYANDPDFRALLRANTKKDGSSTKPKRVQTDIELRERKMERQRAYWINNPEKYEAHKAKMRARPPKERVSTPESRERESARLRAYRARKKELMSKARE